MLNDNLFTVSVTFQSTHIDLFDSVIELDSGEEKARFPD